MGRKPKTVSDEIRATLEDSWTKTKLAILLEISAPTLYKKLEDNDWSDAQLETLRKHKVISRVGRIK